MRPAYTCPGCDTVLPSIKGAGNHGKYAKHCTPEMRFWGRIKIAEGCWLWQGAVNTTGYGMACWANGEKNIVAHRLVYQMVKGPVPEGIEVCHTCDVPRCCNPEHLFLGTHQDNMQDRVRKGRIGRVLKPDEVRQIRKLIGTKSQEEIAAMFGVRPLAINDIRLGSTFQWLK